MSTRGILIRQTTTALLAAAGTLAGVRVEDARTDPIQAADTPRIVVWWHEEGEGLSPAGTAPMFKMTGTLDIQAVMDSPALADVVATLDTLEPQILDALLTDPAWTRLANNPDTLRVARKYGSGESLVLGELTITMTVTWRDRYEPVLVTKLRTVRIAAADAAGGAMVVGEVDGLFPSS